MKKITIKISYDEEKFSILKLYIENRNSTIEDELVKAFDALFMKTVPAGVREFLNLKNKVETKPVSSKTKYTD